VDHAVYWNYLRRPKIYTLAFGPPIHLLVLVFDQARYDRLHEAMKKDVAFEE